MTIKVRANDIHMQVALPKHLRLLSQNLTFTQTKLCLFGLFTGLAFQLYKEIALAPCMFVNIKSQCIHRQ